MAASRKPLKARDQVRIVDPNVAAGEGSCTFIPGMHNTIATIVGKCKDILTNRKDTKELTGKFVVCIPDLKLESQLIDSNGVLQPTWYILPMTKTVEINKIKQKYTVLDTPYA